MTVTELLAKSRDAHARYRHAAGHVRRDGAIAEQPNNPLARDVVSEALDYRQQAETLDPDHDDSAWNIDQAAMKGQASATLIKFYQSFFTS